MEPHASTPMEAQTIVSVVRRRWKMIVGFVVLAAIGAIGMSLLQEERYRASTDLLLSRPLDTGELTESGRANEIQILESRQLQDAVEEQLGGDADASVEVIGDSDVVSISATHTDAETAASISDAYAQVYLEQRRERSLDELSERRAEVQSRYDAVSEQLDELTAPVDELDDQIAAAATDDEREQLEDQRQRVVDDIAPQRQSLVGQQATYAQELNELLVQQSTLDTNTGEVISAAEVPTSPYQPAPVRNGASAVVIAAVLAVGLAFLRERLDDSIPTAEDLRILTRLPTLGTLPDLGNKWQALVDGREVASASPVEKLQNLASSFRSLSVPTDVDTATRSLVEAFRKVRTAINFAAFDRPIDSMAVTSAVSGEGKTTTALGLTSMFAAEGRDVILVECDLRRPSLSQRLGLPVQAGLAEVLAGQETLEQATTRTRTRIDEWVAQSGAPHEQQKEFSVLLAGSTPPNAAELLSSLAMRQLVAKLVAEYDVVVLDVPPLLAVSDGLVLSGLVDGVLLVASRRLSRGTDVTAALDSLDTNRARVIGTVFNRADRGPAYYG